jgi:hypothetical protein
MRNFSQASISLADDASAVESGSNSRRRSSVSCTCCWYLLISCWSSSMLEFTGTLLLLRPRTNVINTHKLRRTKRRCHGQRTGRAHARDARDAGSGPRSTAAFGVTAAHEWRGNDAAQGEGSSLAMSRRQRRGRGRRGAVNRRASGRPKRRRQRPASWTWPLGDAVTGVDDRLGGTRRRPARTAATLTVEAMWQHGTGPVRTATPLKACDTQAGWRMASTCPTPSDKRAQAEMRRPTGGPCCNCFPTQK